MNNVIIRSPWIVGNLSLQPGKIVQISIVAYEHSSGMPARFCAGLIPAVDLSNRLKKNGFDSMVRVIDPTPIADYCNGWQAKQSYFRDVVADFFGKNETAFFFDKAEEIGSSAIELLRELGAELESSSDRTVVEMVQRIKKSGKSHGGDVGANNATLYMAAHPFSWIDMYHQLIWKKTYSAEGCHFINLMSTAEERFAVIRKFLQKKRPDLCTGINSIDRFMAVCNTPCYIPLANEPTFKDLSTNGYNWCQERYCNLKIEGNGHVRAHKDFEALMSFLGLNAT